MTSFLKSAGLVIAGIVVGALFLAVGSHNLGGVYNQVTNYFKDGIVIGDNAGTPTMTVDSTGAIATTGGFSSGGGITATSSSVTGGTDLLVAANFDTENVIDYTANKGSMTLTLPAKATFPLSSTAGVCRTFYIRNATTTAAVALTLAGNTGTLLKGVATSTLGTVGFKTILGDTDASNYAELNACRKTNGDIIVGVKTFID